MKLNYIEKDGVKLFSLHRHDYRRFETGEYIDGGLDYTRSNTEVKSAEIKDLIEDLRQIKKLLLEEEFAIQDWSNKLLRTYIRILVNKPSHDDFQKVIFEILTHELLYRNDKKRKVKTI